MHCIQTIMSCTNLPTCSNTAGCVRGTHCQECIIGGVTGNLGIPLFTG